MVSLSRGIYAVLLQVGLCSALLFASGLTIAETPKTEPATAVPQVAPLRAVIELFTSQGCGDCPPANQLLKDYAEKPDVIALTLPVNYWDYLGWKDTLASARNGERQRAYAKRFDTGPVSTPEAVVNGAAHALGSSEDEIEQAIRATETALRSSRVPVRAWRVGASVIIEVGAAKYLESVKESTIWLAVVQKQAVVSVEKGENKGRALTFHHVVREMTPIGLWTGRPTTIRLAAGALMHPAGEHFVVLLQEESTGPIIGAAELAP